MTDIIAQALAEAKNAKLREACQQLLVHVEADEVTHGRTFAAGRVARAALAAMTETKDEAVKGMQLAMGLALDRRREIDYLQADNARLREALEALLVMHMSGEKPQKLNDALTWRQNDELAIDMAQSALAAKEKP